MKLQGSHIFPVSPEKLWSTLLEPSTLTAVMPGCQTLTPVTENQYQGELIIPLGPMAGTYTGNLALSHIVENEGYTFTFTAQSKAGTIGGNGRLQLQVQENGTQLSYEGEAKVGGQLANHATPLLETTARSLIRQSLENLESSLQSDATPMPIQPQETQKEPALRSHIPGNQQTTILAVTALIIVILFTLFYFFNRKPQNQS